MPLSSSNNKNLDLEAKLSKKMSFLNTGDVAFTDRTNHIPEKDRYIYYDGSIITLDPVYSEVAEDGFNIFVDEKTNEELLLIYIADPTDVVDPSSELFTQIIDRGQTRHMLNKQTQYLFPSSIRDDASLNSKSGNETVKKKVITVVARVENNIPVLKEIVPGLVHVKRSHNLTYGQAVDMKDNPSIEHQLKRGLEISNAIKRKFSREVSGVIPVLNQVNSKIAEFEDMVDELTRFANTEVCKYIKAHLPSEIIKEYSESGNKSFTRPLEYASDCITHYYLKAIWIERSKHEYPFIGYLRHGIHTITKHLDDVATTMSKN